MTCLCCRPAGCDTIYGHRDTCHKSGNTQNTTRPSDSKHESERENYNNSNNNNNPKQAPTIVHDKLSRKVDGEVETSNQNNDSHAMPSTTWKDTKSGDGNVYNDALGLSSNDEYANTSLNDKKEGRGIVILIELKQLKTTSL